jgi:hypothetical protein
MSLEEQIRRLKQEIAEIEELNPYSYEQLVSWRRRVKRLVELSQGELEQGSPGGSEYE